MSGDLTYEYLTRHIVPGPYWPTFLPALCTLPAALLIPRHVLSRRYSIAIFAPLITGLIGCSCYFTDGSDVIAIDTLLWALFLLVFRDPWQDFRRVDTVTLHTDEKIFRRRDQIASSTGATSPVKSLSDSDEQPGVLKGSKKPQQRIQLRKRVSFRASEHPYPEARTDRLRWVGTLLASIRLCNWKIGSYTHDRSQPSPPGFASREVFVRQTLISFVRGYLILDVTRAYIDYDVFFTDPSVSINSALPPFNIVQILPPYFLRTAITAAQAWALISEMFYLPCLLPVALNFYSVVPDEWSPHNWPAYFASMRCILTDGVRGFWGQYWHQTMRWAVAGPGYALADAMNIDRRFGRLRYAIIAASAFLFSGIVHMGLVPPEPIHATIPTNHVRLLVAGFFWAQYFAVLVEIMVATTVVRFTPPDFWRKSWASRLRLAVNLIWTIVWFGTSTVLLTEAGRQLGYWRVWPVPISICRGLLGKGFVAWPFLLS